MSLPAIWSWRVGPRGLRKVVALVLYKPPAPPAWTDALIFSQPKDIDLPSPPPLSRSTDL